MSRFASATHSPQLLNRKVAKTLANLEHAEERAAELQRRIDEAKAAREARQKALQRARGLRR